MNTGNILEKAARLADLIEYQSGSVVSRTIIDKRSGTVTLFAFDKGQGLSEHTAPFDAFMYMSDGEIEVTISGKADIVREGDVIIMPAGKPHSLKAVERSKMLLVMIRN